VRLKKIESALGDVEDVDDLSYDVDTVKSDVDDLTAHVDDLENRVANIEYALRRQGIRF
jgi:polyhydroxyalkanoate synthesis regulator phasin